MGDGDHRPSGHRPGERHHPGSRGPDLGAGDGGQVDAPVPGAPWSRRCLEAADHGSRPAARPVHRPRPLAADTTAPAAVPAVPAVGTRPGPERPGPPGRQQRDQHHQDDHQDPPSGR
ncbi:hypothetical protein ACFVFS_29070 [Kitasatospora sp. NPDC057692]|uniref:hypothetical protein n=1 Tax=Kitasatospora sp. NPDC057692 TaxID=3346215 RepID=UPI0036C1CB6A